MSEVVQSVNSSSIVLNVEPEQFEKFISSLLGKPQTIRKFILGSFEVNLHEVENIFHLVDQRVMQQNKGSLIQFTVKTIYDDGSSVLFNSFSDFKAYSEIRPVVSVAVHLSWTYMVQFQGRSVSEKQNIDLSFLTSEASLPDFLDEDVFLMRPRNLIDMRINHTARSWGADIEGLLSGHLQSLVKPENSVKRFIRLHSGKIGACVFGLLILSFLVAGYLATQAFAREQIAHVSKYATNTSIQIDQKIEFLAHDLASGSWHRFLSYITSLSLISLIIAVVLGVWVAEASKNRPPSFVLLSRKSEDHKMKLLEKQKKKWLGFTVSIIVSLLLGVLSNYLFANMGIIWNL